MYYAGFLVFVFVWFDLVWCVWIWCAAGDFWIWGLMIGCGLVGNWVGDFL